MRNMKVVGALVLLMAIASAGCQNTVEPQKPSTPSPGSGVVKIPQNEPSGPGQHLTGLRQLPPKQ